MEEENYGSSVPFMELQSDLKAFLSDKVVKKDFVGFTNGAFKSGDGDLGYVDIKVDWNVKYDENQFADTAGNGNEHKSGLDFISRKRKRECYLSMLSWIREVAKDPCDFAVEPMPERHKWKCYGAEIPWKKILLAREAMLLKKNVDASSQQSIWQRKQKMHPSMYEDDQCNSERQRCSQRLLFAKDPSQKPRERLFQESSSSDFQSDEDKADRLFDSTAESTNFCANQRRQKRIPIGPNSQADIPDFVGEGYYRSDSQWLGTRIWPFEKGEQRSSLIERDPIGKGRQQTCGCEYPGSFDCVKFHVREKRVKLKLELGSAYSKWKFDNMGELVALSWTKEDESTFQRIVDSNRLSSEKYFWDELFKCFPKKGREALVSYYYNVFVLRRRGCQNRSGTSEIDSDDEDSEFGPIGNRFGQIAANSQSSIFCSPKKPHSNVV
ncbi:AT-rich interactive domain-containing protein 1 [Striga hermonthica]|uniref:AT-rich interactive domain-containing protein 1 n=1 Tax=Striga hermonthica TaxID=68872 RepID=A0A9N7P4I3_STRHE|nr:AT-rich interactive domain-containing protein 1 [Striga hermonthica]